MSESDSDPHPSSAQPLLPAAPHPSSALRAAPHPSPAQLDPFDPVSAPVLPVHHRPSVPVFQSADGRPYAWNLERTDNIKDTSLLPMSSTCILLTVQQEQALLPDLQETVMKPLEASRTAHQRQLAQDGGWETFAAQKLFWEHQSDIDFYLR